MLAAAKAKNSIHNCREPTAFDPALLPGAVAK
jgi:hypothetical protein